MIHNRDGQALNIEDRVSAVVTTLAQTSIIEGTIREFRYSGLQVLLKTESGDEHWCNALSAELVPPQS